MNFKNYLLTIVIFAISISSIKAQDKIYRKNGEVIKCKVTSRDSLNYVNFIVYKRGKDIKTYLNNDEVDKIVIGNESTGFERKTDKVSAGFGSGLDYGGIGLNLTIYPVKYVGFFAGIGSNFKDLGYNVGAKFRYTSNTARISPFATVMYGYNAAVIVQNEPALNKTFYGITYGLGVDFRFSSRSNNYFSLGLLLPQRGMKVEKYMNDNGIVLENDLPSYAISLGYRIILK